MSYAINFRATWCIPCIKEIPYFEQLGEQYREEKVKALMVSLDMADQLKGRLIPFMEKEQLRNVVITAITCAIGYGIKIGK